MQRVTPLFALIALIPALALADTPASQPECSWDGIERIVAVGDVHGDFSQLVKVLRAAEVIDAKDNWVAGKTHLVQTGDVLDRGPDSRKAMDLLMKLERQAAEAGGAVHALLGNHEAMMLHDDWRYVHPEEPEAFGGEEAYRRALSAEGLYGRWIRRHNTAIRINDVLFVHAGLTAKCKDLTLAEINRAVRAELDKPDSRGLATDSAGPLWDRTLAEDDERLIRPELEAVLAKFNARHMVIGHTVSTEGVVTRAGGRLIRIDVGMSGFYNGPAACLLIDKGVFHEIRAGEVKRKLAIEVPASQPETSQPDAPARKAA